MCCGWWESVRDEDNEQKMYYEALLERPKGNAKNTTGRMDKKHSNWHDA